MRDIERRCTRGLQPRFRQSQGNVHGTFDLTVQNRSASALVVTAGQIIIEGAIKASSSNNMAGGGIQLNASNSD